MGRGIQAPLVGGHSTNACQPIVFHVVSDTLRTMPLNCTSSTLQPVAVIGEAMLTLNAIRGGMTPAVEAPPQEIASPQGRCSAN
jgi:hypothetical protein